MSVSIKLLHNSNIVSLEWSRVSQRIRLYIPFHENPTVRGRGVRVRTRYMQIKGRAWPPLTYNSHWFSPYKRHHNCSRHHWTAVLVTVYISTRWHSWRYSSKTNRITIVENKSTLFILHFESTCSINIFV